MVAESRCHADALALKIDIEQIYSEAQHRWLRPPEICKILRNYTALSLPIARETPTRPPSGSLFLFDRKVLRNFRKDGHNWRKNKDGKNGKEAHEKLKDEGKQVLHCYYARGEENGTFQRRSYWMIEEDLADIVLVHYLEVKENKTNFSCLRDAGDIPGSWQTEDASNVNCSGFSRIPSHDHHGASEVTDIANIHSTIQGSEHEHTEPVYNYQASPGFRFVQELQAPTSQTMEAGCVPYYTVPASDSYQGQISTTPGMSFGSISEEKNKNPMDIGVPFQFLQDLMFRSWENTVGENNTDYQCVNIRPPFPSGLSSGLGTMIEQENELMDQYCPDLFGQMQEVGNHLHGSEEWQLDSDRDSPPASHWPWGQNSDGVNLGQNPYYTSRKQPLLTQDTELNNVNQELSNAVGIQKTHITEQSRQLSQDDLHQLQVRNAVGNSLESHSNGNLIVEDKSNYLPLKQPPTDDFMQGAINWIKEQDVMTEATIQVDSSLFFGSEDVPHLHSDNYILGPSISQDQLFSIVDFSPNWAYSWTKIKVLVRGRFLKSQEEVRKCTWACMFGELEVPAEVVADGVLQCRTPSHENGKVSFYVTSSNRVACSEVQEFEFRPFDEKMLHIRFEKLLSLQSSTSPTSNQSSSAKTLQLCSKISAMLQDDSEQDKFAFNKVDNQIQLKLFKAKLNSWLLQKIVEGGKGSSILDEGGQGMLHFVAALGYDWAISPTITAGVNINFRDANGWSALHWAAYNGRERTVGLLISLGAAPGFVTDPTPKHPSGSTPADLASSNGHKGIAGFLAESSLSSLLSSLTLKDSNGSDRGSAVVPVSRQMVTPVVSEDLPLKDSLTAVRNATQAASRIHEVYRAQSFQRRQIKEYNDCELRISEDCALSLLALRGKKAGQHNELVHAAAVRIQNKFRSRKGRKDFLVTRKQIIKIQAHVRGYQVRKIYRKMICCARILIVILRWRRKGRELSGFKPEGPAASSSMHTETPEDEYEYLKEGRKQTEKRLEKALAIVKSMVRYREARDQYCRVLNAVSGMQPKKAS